MRIAIDGMGGDRAPQVVVDGVVAAAREYDYDMVLVGDKTILRRELSRYKRYPDNIFIEHAPEVVLMDEPPAISVRKKRNSSIAIGIDLLKNGEADAFICAGNTGAVVCSATLGLGLLPGIERPGISIVFPTFKGVSMMIDVGANIDPKPLHLLHYGIMGDAYSKYILNKSKPMIGLLSIGEEATKGTDFIKETHKLLDDSRLNFIGNVEGRDVFTGRCDVVLCDGFVGNVVLKVAEGIGGAITKLLKSQIKNSVLAKIGALMSKPAFLRLWKDLDYSEYGGAPLLGVAGHVIISHGSSSAKAIKNAIRRGAEYKENELNKRIVEELESY
ncbi:MAG: phosphate acyltransferase PlsX [Candidatus Omnitrophica bacterium]|nr:phosphate acyltransferase PlsX [Candidatus Omnitrophota bacterium]MBU4487653.1 phosphate acyltransferase PlsX [Candidatus Omnitrophota bacterium]MCG2705422.1 phosphate acyltransferase PlsX [Candidatus Omnitrophota bacterium]